MKLTSLKQKYSDHEKGAGAETDEYYPSLYLDEKQLELMGVDAARVGTEMQMMAMVRVSSVNDSKNGQRSMAFEVLEAAFAPKETKPDASTILFPNG